jgi:pimeloyl-ACP methyl ester carboxylesterase
MTTMEEPQRTPIPVTAEKHILLSADGLELHADAWGCPDAPPVLLLHGGGQTRHAWAGTGRELAEAGWYALSVDMRGHGESDWCEDGNYLHDDFAADTLVLIRSFDQSPVVVGASLGGISALLAIGELAQESAARALVLVDIATRMEPDGAQRIIQFMKARPDGFESLEEVADAIAAYNPHRPRPKSLSGLQKNLRHGEDGRYRWHWDPRFLEGPKNPTNHSEFKPGRLEDAGRGLSLPTLLVRGRMSDLLSEEGAREFLELVPHAKYADVSGAGHMVAGDRNDVFSKAVIGFLDQEV